MIICLVSYVLCLSMFMLALIESDNIKEKEAFGYAGRKVRDGFYKCLMELFTKRIVSYTPKVNFLNGL